MDPYDVGDKQYTATLPFDREDGVGDRYWSYPVRHDDSQAGPQTYFYRAMKPAEAASWLTMGADGVVGSDGIIDANAHQGWASHRNYSLGYLSRKHGYTHLIEVYAPYFLERLAEIGVKTGKPESGDMSWGIGGRNSNGFKPNGTTNRALADVYADLVGGTERNGRRQALAVTPLIFKDSIERIKLVNFRSQKP
jgi:hypothetical protein